MLDFFANRLKWFSNRTIIRVFLLTIVCLVAFVGLAYPIAIRPSSFPLKTGGVAPQDIQAPRSLTFASQILTDKARKEIERSVSPVYLPADPAIARQKINKLRTSLNFINNVRNDSFSSPAQKNADLSTLTTINLSGKTSNDLLAMTDEKWQAVQQESQKVLEEVMRNSIRPDQVMDFQHSIPTLVNLSLPENQASLVASLVSPFVTANSLFSDNLTKLAISDAKNSLSPVMVNFLAGETILRRGQVLGSQDLEALQQFGLIETPRELPELVGVFSIVLICGSFAGLYFARRRIAPFNDFRGLALISLTFLLFVISARLVIPNRTIIPYIFPMAAFALTVSSLYNMEIGLILSLVLSVLAAYSLPNSLDLTLYYILTSMVGVLVLGKGHRVASFFWAGIAIGVVGSGVVLGYRLSEPFLDLIGIATLVGASFLNGIAAAGLTLLFQFLFSQLLGVTTALQLLDLSRPDHPLLQFMLRNAPGSYQHALQVANIAEQASEAIGADALLTRVGSLYHDVGKAANPLYFVENQVAGKPNPHEDLDPASSASIIIRHVKDGLDLARKHRLPPQIRSFIAEHHGTQITRFQYARALEAVGPKHEAIDLASFRYPGPTPSSRETAILMLADGCEARARAELPKNEQELTVLVNKVIDYCQKEGQLDQTSISLRDLKTAANSIVEALRNSYHARIHYPEEEKQTKNTNATESMDLQSSMSRKN